MASSDSDLVISSLLGGMNDTDPPSSLPNDQCVLAENVEFFYSMLGERRLGCGPLTITSSGLSDETHVTYLTQWFPQNDVLNPEFFAVAATPGTSTTVAKRTDGTWSEITPTDALNTAATSVFGVDTQSLNGKLFVAYKSAQDRLHVWDGTTLRRTGFAEPAAPTGANTGAGTYTGTRYFRVRYTAMSGSTVLRRSEPSPTLTFAPSGTGTGVVVTKPAALSEGETHWELEASLDDADYYIIATTLVATTTVTDSTAYATGYASQGDLSEDIGEYINIGSAKYLSVDGDRLIFAGHWTDLSKQSQVGWTPVYNDDGVGNDERFPLSVNNTVNLDNYEGGPITGISAGANGSWYVFKWEHIYKMVRTGDINRAYDVLTISKSQGAIPGSIVDGVDENGSSCVYFLDPSVGSCRIGAGGLQQIIGLRRTWGRVNLRATNVVARGCYYPYKQQVHWWVAVDGANSPNLKLVLQTTELQAVKGNTIGRGWSTATGTIAEAFTAAVLTEVVIIDGVTGISERPFIGLASPATIQRCDTEITDAGDTYVATIRTRPYIVNGLLNFWGAMTASLLAYANDDSTLAIKFLRDFSIETNEVETDLEAEGSEEIVIKTFDDLVMSGAKAIQVEFTDPV